MSKSYFFSVFICARNVGTACCTATTVHRPAPDQTVRGSLESSCHSTEIGVPALGGGSRGTARRGPARANRFRWPDSRGSCEHRAAHGKGAFLLLLATETSDYICPLRALNRWIAQPRKFSKPRLLDSVTVLWVGGLPWLPEKPILRLFAAEDISHPDRMLSASTSSPGLQRVFYDKLLARSTAPPRS